MVGDLNFLLMDERTNTDIFPHTLMM